MSAMCAAVKTQQRLASALPGFHQPRPKRETGGVAQPQSLSILICKMVERRVKVAQSCLTLCLSYSPWNSPGQNTGVGSLSFLQGIFPTQGLDPGLPHCRLILYQLSHQKSPQINTRPTSRGSDLGVKPASLTSPALAGGFFTTSTTWESPLTQKVITKTNC